MRVEDIMTRTVVSVSPATSIKRVATLLLERRISGLPVVGDDGGVLGIVSEADIVTKTAEDAIPSSRLFDTGERALLEHEARTAAEAMTAPAVTVSPLASVADAARLMGKRSINRLPVVTGGRLVGIVTRADIVRAFARPDDELTEEIRIDVLRDTLWIDPDELGVEVEDGAVRIAGIVDTRTIAALIPGYVGLVPGVVSVDASGLRWRRDDLVRRGVRAKLSAPRR